MSSKGTPLTEKIGRIRQAILSHNKISFRYFYEKGECQRVIEPYRLVFQWAAWYVFGYCMEREDFRLFRLNRLCGLALLAEEFVPREIPPERLAFSGCLAAGGYRLKAIFEESQKYRLIEEYGPECWSLLADGRLLFERDFASYRNMREWVLSFGSHALVLEPQALRDDIRRTAEILLQNYRET